MADESTVALPQKPLAVAESSANWAQNFEWASKVFTPFVIPITTAIIGAFIALYSAWQQHIIENKKIDLEYVKIARDTLSNVKPDTDQRIIGWAYKTLFDLSPTKVDSGVIADLSKQRVPLPSSNNITTISDIPESQIDQIEKMYRLEGAINIERIKQNNGKYTLRVMYPRSK